MHVNVATSAQLPAPVSQLIAIDAADQLADIGQLADIDQLADVDQLAGFC
jgi:hypothetical protein